MTLPYGTAALAGALTCFFIGSVKALAMPLAGVGAVTLLASILSLQAWKKGSSTATYTLVSARTLWPSPLCLTM